MFRTPDKTLNVSKILSHPPGRVGGNPMLVNPDGTITRLGLRIVPATPNHGGDINVYTKDISLNSKYDTFIRLFLPCIVIEKRSSNSKLPVIVYFHGGGFMLYSAATPIFHNFCAKMAHEIGAIVASVDYRCAPEHCLPAAYEDAMEALHLLSKNNDEWLRDFADVSKCFLVGECAGANIVYHTGEALVAEFDRLKPLEVKGLVLVHAMFGGQERTESELRFSNDPLVSISANDFAWDLSLPIGCDRDHLYSNPIANNRANKWGRVIFNSGLKILVVGCKNDPLYDRQNELVKVLKEEGVHIIADFWERGSHSIQLHDDEKAKHFFAILRKFMHSPQSRL